MTFRITDFVEFDSRNRAVCPSCAADGKTKKKNLALVPNTDGAYKCHRGCSSEDIRAALGNPKPKQVPSTQAEVKKVTVSPQKMREGHNRLLAHRAAMQWLEDRGIHEDIITRHRLGLTTCKVGRRRADAITFYIPANEDRTAYYQKKRVAPWDPAMVNHDDYQPWKQYGVPSMVYFTLKPDNPEVTWLCEGEWDALMLADRVRNANFKGLPAIAVATFTSGSGAVPPPDQLERLPGKVVIWYDRNDKPTKTGKIPGADGAKAVAKKLGDRALIAEVPGPEDLPHGWDVSDALTNGWNLALFVRAAAEAKPLANEPEPKPENTNPVLSNLRWNPDLIANAPEYTEFLVPDLLTEDELFVLAAPPRAGKSLMAMELARAVATGSKFLGRPCTQGTVLYVKCEDSDTKIKERQEAQGWARDLPVAWLDRFKLGDIDALDEAVDQLDARLVILDTLSRVKDAAISESSAEMSQLLEPLQTMANRRGCCVVLVHHTGKINPDIASQQDIFDTIRGSSAIRAVCRGSMVLAKGENSYRLVCENGWGKHDLRIAFDVDRLRWELLGEWNPPKNQSQQDRIIAALKKLGEASIEQLFVETGIARKSLYKQIGRLMASEIGGEKIEKRGTRRKYTYRLALFDTIRQIEALSNNCRIGENLSPNGVQATIRQKEGKKVFPSDQANFDHSSVPVENPNLPIFDNSLKGGELSNSDTQTPMKTGDSTIRQLFDKGGGCRIADGTGENEDLSNDVPVECPNSDQPKNVHQRTFSDGIDLPFDVGHVIEILRPGTLIGQHATVVAVDAEDKTVEVNRDGWVSPRIYEWEEVELAL